MELAGSDLILHAGGQATRFPREFLDLIAFFRDSHTVAEGFEFLGRLAKNPHDLAQAFARMQPLGRKTLRPYLSPSQKIINRSPQNFRRPFCTIVALRDWYLAITEQGAH
jgi:hypothetical protein